MKGKSLPSPAKAHDRPQFLPCKYPVAPDGMVTRLEMEYRKGMCRKCREDVALKKTWHDARFL
jgi:hypothetical protein